MGPTVGEWEMKGALFRDSDAPFPFVPRMEDVCNSASWYSVRNTEEQSVCMESVRIKILHDHTC